jgi:hypothetical protein
MWAYWLATIPVNLYFLYSNLRVGIVYILSLIFLSLDKLNKWTAVVLVFITIFLKWSSVLAFSFATIGLAFIVHPQFFGFWILGWQWWVGLSSPLLLKALNLTGLSTTPFKLASIFVHMYFAWRIFAWQNGVYQSHDSKFVANVQSSRRTIKWLIGLTPEPKMGPSGLPALSWN